MNWRQFSVALVQALAWPSVVLVVLLMYRRRVAHLLGDGLRRLTVGPFQAEWDRGVEETRATIEVAEALPALEESDSDRSLIEKQLREARAFLPVSPAAAIAIGGQASQTALEVHLPMDDEELSRIHRMGPLLKRARERGLINPGAALVFEHLQRLRNLAAHGGSERQAPTAEQAEEYLQLVEEFLALLTQPPTVSQPRAPLAGEA